MKHRLALVFLLAVLPAGRASEGSGHWAFEPLKASPPPVIENTTWPRGPIDLFILARLREKGIEPNGDAEKRTLIRRVTYDLIGLPPTPEEIDAFLNDKADGAFARVVERLLDSPHYGERWGRHWMDLVRYADTAGDNSDYPIPQLYLYRNYIIDAFNQDKPFDQFVREQIAGDLLPAKSQDERNRQVIATGYIALSRRFGSVVDRYPQHQTIEDTLDNVGRTFMGLSLSCARCHDHKFDPVSTRDYYGLYGIFESTRYAFPGIELLKTQKDFAPLISDADYGALMAPHQQKDKELQRKHDDLSGRRRALEAEKTKLDEAIKNASDGDRKALTEENQKLYLRIDDLRGKVRAAGEAIEAHRRKLPAVADAYAVRDEKPRDAAIQVKGDPEKLSDVVSRKFPDALGGHKLLGEQTNQSGRLQLAEWIVQSPVTARVIVNRVWHYHFGAGLVRTPSDFGVRGLPPTHPELLDWLARRFIDNGWSIKKLHREILLSRTYAMSSEDNPAALAIDPDNELNWRVNLRRLDAESLRDTILAISGLLDRSRMDEPHPFPSRDKWDFTQHHPFKDSYESRRRSVYLMSKRITAAPYFQAFDGPDPNVNTPDRDSSVTTVQALYFLNSDFVHEQSLRFAKALQAESSGGRERIARAFELTLGRKPRANEMEMAERHLAKISGEGDGQGTETAWASFARVLFRLNEFIYLD